MATYTPNFNLSRPDDGDTFQATIQAYKNNLDTIDNNLGGGGSGGHTIYDENGTALTQESGLQFTGSVSVTDDNINGRTVVNIGGGGSLNIGVYVDPTQIIASGTWNTSFSYTATTDCFVFLDGDLDNSHYAVYIDGVKIFDLGSAMYTEHMSLFPLRKGQVMTATKATTYALNFVVYGALQGTNGIFAPVIYSDVERVIGTWRDNKPLYERTFSLGALPNNAIKTVAHGIANIDTIFVSDSFFINPSGGSSYLNFTNDTTSGQIEIIVDKTNFEIWAGSNRTTWNGYATVRYTKTTDSAGAGNWNTDGVPTHHYSTSEQVVGTWIDGKPLYEITLTGSTGASINTYKTIGQIQNLESIAQAYGYVKATYYEPIPKPNLTIHISYGNGDVNTYFTSNSYQNKPVTITVQYTKTTD